MYTLNGWWFLSSSGAYPPVFTVGVILIIFTFDLFHSEYIYIYSWIPAQEIFLIFSL